MRKFFLTLLFVLLTVPVLRAQTVFVEAEMFDSYGGWSLDQQFIGTMGSSYLLAHGMGIPVEDASVKVIVPRKGKYHVYVRTYNWTAPFSEGPGPGRFSLSIDDSPLGKILGSEGAGWYWQEAGEIKLNKGSHEISIHDLTGLEGRFDAICLSRKPM